MDNTIKGSIIGALITGVISLLIFILGNFSTQSTIEKKTVETLSGYFNSVDKDMSYEQALQTIYKENKSLKIEIETLKKQIESQQIFIDQKISVENANSIIQSATEYANSSNYIQALSLLNSIEMKTTEVEMLITEFSTNYELYICEQVDSLIINDKLDDAINIIKSSLSILPNSQVLQNKLKEIEKSYPHSMVDVVPAYESGGNGYKEYSATKEGFTDSFTMAGVKYTNGITFDADINILSEDVTWAVYNLSEEYSSLEFIIGHVDSTYFGNETSLQIFYDGVFHEEIPLKPDMIPQLISLDITGVTQLKMQVHSSGLDHPLYGLGNPIIK